MRVLTRLSVSMVLSLIAVSAFAQSTSGSMSGTVVDESNQVVAAATVTIANESSGEERKATTNEAGAFVFSALLPGPYTIKVEMQGFKPLEVKGRVVLANNRLAVGELKLAVGALTESVSVTARGETVATTVTSHQAVTETSRSSGIERSSL